MFSEKLKVTSEAESCQGPVKKLCYKQFLKRDGAGGIHFKWLKQQQTNTCRKAPTKFHVKMADKKLITIKSS